MFRAFLKIRKIYFSHSRVVKIIDKASRLIISRLIALIFNLTAAFWKKNTEDILLVNKSIILLAFFGIGDSLMLTPAIRALKQANTTFKITIVTKEGFVDIFKNNIYVDEVIGIERADFLNCARILRSRNFELFISFMPHIEYLFFAWLLRPKYLLGYLTSYRRVESVGFKINNPSNLFINALKRNLRVSEAFLGKDIINSPGGLDLDFFIRQEAKSKAGQLLKDIEGDLHQLLVGINPHKTGSWGGMGVWSLDDFVILANKLMAERNVAVIILGGKQDQARSRALFDKIRNQGRALNLAGKTTLEETAAVMSQFSLFITTDSGLMHLAGALRIKTISLFGFSDPESFNSFENNMILQGKTECSPCVKNSFKPLFNYPSACSDPTRCMKAILPDQVLLKVKELL